MLFSVEIAKVGGQSRLKETNAYSEAPGIEASPGTITMRRGDGKLNIWDNCIILLAKSYQSPTSRDRYVNNINAEKNNNSSFSIQ